MVIFIFVFNRIIFCLSFFAPMSPVYGPCPVYDFPDVFCFKKKGGIKKKQHYFSVKQTECPFRKICKLGEVCFPAYGNVGKCIPADCKWLFSFH